MNNRLPLVPSAGDLLIRRPTLSDVAAVAGLINICAVAEIGALQTTVDQLRGHWQMRGLNLPTDCWVVQEPSGRLVGYAEVWDLPAWPAPYIWARVHPDWMGQGLGRRLLRLAEERARSGAAGTDAPRRIILRTAIVSANQPARRLLYQDGYRLVARRWCKGRPADDADPSPDWPQGIPARAYISGEDGPVYRYDIYEKELCLDDGLEPVFCAN